MITDQNLRDRFSRLPKWAQDELEARDRMIKSLTDEIAEMRGEIANPFVWEQDHSPRPVLGVERPIVDEEPIQFQDIADFWMECRAAGDKRWMKLAHRALHGSVDDPVTSDAWECVAEEIIKRREREALLYDMGTDGVGRREGD